MRDNTKNNKEMLEVDTEKKQSFPLVSEMSKEDIDAVLAIGYAECFFSTTKNKEKTSGFWPRETLERWVGSSIDISLVAKNENGVQGFVLTTINLTNRKAECENIWIDPRWRGTKVAQKLMTEMIGRVQETRSADCIVFLAEDDNVVAQNFVQKKAGFEKGKSYTWLVKRIVS